MAQVARASLPSPSPFCSHLYCSVPFHSQQSLLSNCCVVRWICRTSECFWLWVTSIFGRFCLARFVHTRLCLTSQYDFRVIHLRSFLDFLFVQYCFAFESMLWVLNFIRCIWCLFYLFVSFGDRFPSACFVHMIHPSHFVFRSIRWPASLIFLGSPVWFRMVLTWGFRLREEALEFGRCTYCAICKVGSSLFARRFDWPVSGLSGLVLFRWGIVTTKIPVRVYIQFPTFLLLWW